MTKVDDARRATCGKKGFARESGGFGVVLILAVALWGPLRVAGVAAEVDGASGEPANSVASLAAAARQSVVVLTYYGRDGEEEGVGTGFVVSSNGLIATCQHVIGEGRPIKVRLADGREVEATAVAASDRQLDLAIVQIEASDLPALPLGDSDELKQGDAVVAMGNPMGLELSVVQGVLSARRDFEGQEMLQLAIPIEPGNSGGPLLDGQGRVQGVLNMKSAVTRNLGFAIPINRLRPLLAKPNPIPMRRWLTIGTLDTNEWDILFGARWSRKGGLIEVAQPGSGFGGRSLLLSHQETPPRPYEVTVTVKLDDESGAAGLVFGSDGDERHYGFYPSSGQIRLTRFDGPSVYTWTILEQFATPHYRPGDWNTLKVRREEGRLLGYINGHLVVESTDEGLPDGRVGLAKFRHTAAQFKRFRVGREVDEGDPPLSAELLGTIRDFAADPAPEAGEEGALVVSLLPQAESGRRFLNEEAHRLQAKAEELRRLSQEVHRRAVERELADFLAQPEAEIDLMKASLLVAKLDDPEVDIEAYLDHVRGMAAEIRAMVPDEAPPSDLLRALSQYLFEENGFHGSRADYYHQANSYMNRVLDDREGIPITLSVLFIELAARLGLSKVAGLPLPGHFMVQYAPADDDVTLIDVYEGGKIVSREEAEKRVLQTVGVRVNESSWRPATKKDIIVRMLRNLQRIAEDDGRTAEELKYQNVILALIPDSSVDRFQRAGLHLRARDGEAARRDLKWLLDHQPPGLDLDRIADIYRSLEADP